MTAWSRWMKVYHLLLRLPCICAVWWPGGSVGTVAVMKKANQLRKASLSLKVDLIVSDRCVFMSQLNVLSLRSQEGDDV